MDDRRLLADAITVIDRYEAVPVTEEDRVLVHTDVGFHNLGIDSCSFTVNGIFDYGDAAWADRHHDFRYLVFGADHSELLDSALAVYEPAVGQKIEEDRVFLYNAACAITFLAYRAGTRPEDRSCGRTLAEDLEWTKIGIERGLGSTGYGWIRSQAIN